MTAAPLRRFAACALAGAAVIAFSLLGGRSIAMPLDVTENEIVSLSNAPVLVAADASVAETGEPAVRLELEFPNDCYADVGARLDLLRKQGERGGAVLLVLQRVPQEGCPDIYQPTRRTIGVVLPSDLAGQAIDVVARQAVDHFRSVRLDRAAGTTPLAADMVREPHTPSEIVLAIESARIAPSGANGYVVTSAVRLANDCGERDISVRVFEAPDPEGTPRSDIMLIVGPASCAATPAETATEVAVRVDTPQPRAGRRLLIINAAAPGPMRLPD